MPSYQGTFAELYDLFYADKDYLSEAKHIHKWLLHFGSKKKFSLLEIACGTGNHSFYFEKLGYKITAIDYSTEMIKIAKQKAKQFKSSIKFSVCDMRNLPLYKNKFDASICLFDSIGYALTNEAIKNTLIGARKNLKKNGLFIFEFWHAAAMMKYFESRREKNISTENNECIKRISETEIDYYNQSCSVKYTIKKSNKNDKHSIYTETHHNRFFLIQEMNLFLTQSGFLPLKFLDGFSDNENINEHSWHIVAITRCR